MLRLALDLSTVFFFFSSRRRHTRSVSAFLLNRSSDLTRYKQASHFVHIPGLSYSGVKSPTECQQSLFESHFASDRKSGSAGMPRPISYAVFCLKKKKINCYVLSTTNTELLLHVQSSVSVTRYLRV